MSMRGFFVSLFGLALAATLACGYRPPRFADRPSVAEVHDDRPIPIPRRHAFLKEVFAADTYIRRELVRPLDPRRAPAALDVSSFDEVPRSSWFVPRDAATPLAGYFRDGPPEAPFRLVDAAPNSGIVDARVMIDARGLYYELLPELPGQEGMRSGAAVVATRLLYALGYHTSEVHAIRAHTGTRMAAMRWPVGIDLGPTSRSAARSDDPNDHLPHVDRRTLRALPMFGAWLAMSELSPSALRDVYVGEPGHGHVQHFLVGLDRALGIADYVEAVQWASDADREHKTFFFRVFGMGLSPIPSAVRPITLFPSVGLFDENILAKHERPSPPFEPRDRLLPSDEYWAAKRLAALPETVIADAILAAKLGDHAQNWLFQVLQLRRAKIVARAFDHTTPCEVVHVAPPDKAGPARLVLANLAVRYGFMRGEELDYRVVFVDDQGDTLLSLSQSSQASRPSSGSRAIVEVPLPVELSRHDYVVARITAVRRGRALPRALDVHLRAAGRAFRVLAVRH